ncbi:SpaA isopeptide-forming pilin-related protein [Levilactobacillus tujiorum]|uniref:SpaA isopeptide-forming pilin-related protein n=1 Tax=Levilactobacillus tujiorum TaxID=2912243 RepID=UPI0014566EF6|nr:SpaA isopeptide-forming pilin-related protein [Levilactobacillus tujiorum]NLR32829.1 Cys-Gln thioester bond-forming surface protein [Levilactobacillus tujiorum]
MSMSNKTKLLTLSALSAALVPVGAVGISKVNVKADDSGVSQAQAVKNKVAIKNGQSNQVKATVKKADSHASSESSTSESVTKAVNDSGYLTEDAAKALIDKSMSKTGDFDGQRAAYNQVKNSVSQSTFDKLYPDNYGAPLNTVIDKGDYNQVYLPSDKVGSDPKLKAEAKSSAMKMFDNKVNAATFYFISGFTGSGGIAMQYGSTGFVYHESVLRDADHRAVFCVDYNHHLGSGTGYSKKDSRNFSASTVKKISEAAYFGMYQPHGKTNDPITHQELIDYMATQFVIWHYTDGKAASSFKIDWNLLKQAHPHYATGTPKLTTANVMNAVHRIYAMIHLYETQPAANGTKKAMNDKAILFKYAGYKYEGKTYTLVDEVNGERTPKTSKYFTTKIDKKGINVTPKAAWKTDTTHTKSNPLKITWNKVASTSPYLGLKPTFYTKSGYQEMGFGGGPKQKKISVSVYHGTPDTHIPTKDKGPVILSTHKTDRETGKAIAGTEFQITNEDGDPVTTGFQGAALPNDGKITTDASGTATTPQLDSGTYRLQETHVPAPYVLNDGDSEGLLSDPIELTGHTMTTDKDGKVTGDTDPVYGTVNEPEYGQGNGFTNLQEKGQLQIIKNDATTGSETEGDGTFAGAHFHIQQISDYWGNMPASPDTDDVVTGVDGTVMSRDDLHLGTYTVTETQAPQGYRLDAPVATVTINYKDEFTPVVTPSMDNTLNVTMSNHVGQTRLIIDKTDVRESNTEDGAPSSGRVNGLAGIHFIVTRVFKGENNGVIHYAANQNSEDTSFEQLHPIVSGSTLPDGKDHNQLELITDKDGFARTDFIPYGEYNIHEVPDGKHQAMTDYKIFLGTPHEQSPQGDNQWLNTTTGDTSDSRDEAADVEHIANVPIATMLKIVKVDAESGNESPVLENNAVYEITNNDTGDLVNFWTYNDEDAQNEQRTNFHTNSEGYLILPRQLDKNNKGYTIKEIQAPTGYKLNPATIQFDVPLDSQAGMQNAQVVKQPDTSQKGKIQVTKTGQTINSVGQVTDKQTGIKYHNFKFANLPLKNATFQVIASEDIVKPDGEKKASKGEVVDTITTGDKGIATSKYLELGKYHLKETKAPAGYVIDKNQTWNVDLKYDGQLAQVNQDLNNTNLDINNKLQTLKLNIMKQGEQFKNWVDQGKGFETKNAPLAGVTFGVYNAEDIKNADGKVILAKDNLVGVSTTGKDGLAKFEAKFPMIHFYAKELKTDKNHVLTDGKFAFEYEPYSNNASQTLFIGSNGVGLSKDSVLRSNDQITKKANQALKNSGHTTLHADKASETIRPIDNRLYRGRFAIKKLVEEYKVKDNQPTYTIKQDDKVAKGTTFSLTDSKGKHVQNLVIGANSQAVSHELPVGTYQMKETKAPNDTYRLSKTTYTVKITKDKTTITASGKDAKLNLVTVASVDHSKDADYVAMALPTSNMVADVTDGTDANTSKTKGTLPVDQTYQAGVTANVSEDGSILPEAPATDSSTTTNKVDSTDKTSDAKGNTTGDKSADVKNPAMLDYGGLLAPEGTTDLSKVTMPSNVDLKDNVAPTPASVREAKSQKVSQLTVKNYLKKGKLKFTKTDITNGHELPGAHITITGKNTKIHFVSTSHAKYFTLPDGKYSLRETIAPKGYDKLTHSITFEVKDQKVTPVTMKDNRLGKLKFTKTDVTNTHELPGAHIHIKGKGVNINFISKKTPTYFTLPSGTYSFSETKAPKGYQRSTETGYFKIEDNKITKCQLKDKPAKAMPKTGSEYGGLGAMLLLALGGLATALHLRNKKRED